MERRGGGSIIKFASTSGKRATRFSFVYAAAKAAILGVTRGEAVQLADRGIRVNSVSPAWVWSNPVAKMSGGDGALADEVGGELHILGRIPGWWRTGSNAENRYQVSQSLVHAACIPDAASCGTLEASIADSEP